MRRLRLLLVLSVGIGLVAIGIISPVAGGAEQVKVEAVTPWVASVGSRFIDTRTGKQVTLLGVNAMLGAPSVYSGVAALNVNLVRLVVSWNRLEPTAPVDGTHEWNESALAELDAEVAWFESIGVNVVLDFHQGGWSPYFSRGATGVPAWYYADGRFEASQLPEAEAAFWTTESSRSLPAYAAFARMIALRYRAYPNVVGYDILNEPPPGALGDNPSAMADIFRWEAGIRSVIQSVDPSRTVFVSCCAGGDNEAIWSNFSLLGNPERLAFDFHDYWAGSGPIYSRSLADQVAHLQPILEMTSAAGIPLLIGEWGIPNYIANGTSYQRQMLELFAQERLSSARWFMWPNDAGKYNLVAPNGTLTSLGLQLARETAGSKPALTPGSESTLTR